MKRDPSFRFYPDDFLAGTADMTAEEAGAYIRLLCHQWGKGGLPNDDRRLGMMAGLCQASSLAHAKTKFGLSQDGLLRNTRLEAERAKQEEFRAKQAANGSKRWEKSQTDAKNSQASKETCQASVLADAKAILPFPSPVPFPSPIPVPAPVEDTSAAPPVIAPENPELGIGQKPAAPKFKRSRTIELAKPILAKLNELTGRRYEETEVNLQLIATRLEEVSLDTEGVTKMVERQVNRWKGDEKMEEYLRVSTLFNRTKFNEYYAARDLPVTPKRAGSGDDKHKGGF